MDRDWPDVFWTSCVLEVAAWHIGRERKLYSVKLSQVDLQREVASFLKRKRLMLEWNCRGAALLAEGCNRR